MNDNSLIEEAAEETTITIRLATPGDAAAIDRLAELDARCPGAAPHLVVEDGGEMVAALSLPDGVAVSNPFRLTQEGVSLLRMRAAQLGAASHRPRLRRRRTMRAVVAGAAVALLAVAASAGAAPRPGLPAGTWIGKGTLSGVGTQGGFPSTFSGGMTFRIVVSPGGKVTGTGTWARKMVNEEPMPAVVSSKALVTFAGSPTAITYSGIAKTVMAIRNEGVTRTLTWKPVTVRQALPISRAGSCRAEGRSTVKGLTFRWTAMLQQPSGTTCRS